MSVNDSDPAPSTAASQQAAATSKNAAGSDEKGSIYFNKKTYDSWSDALHAARKVVNKNKDDKATLWYRATIVHEDQHTDYIDEQFFCV
jgi:hypothetical protein